MGWYYQTNIFIVLCHKPYHLKQTSPDHHYSVFEHTQVPHRNSSLPSCSSFVTCNHFPCSADAPLQSVLEWYAPDRENSEEGTKTTSVLTNLHKNIYAYEMNSSALGQRSTMKLLPVLKSPSLCPVSASRCWWWNSAISGGTIVCIHWANCWARSGWGPCPAMMVWCQLSYTSFALFFISSEIFRDCAKLYMFYINVTLFHFCWNTQRSC